jgi:hypothetical protein
MYLEVIGALCAIKGRTILMAGARKAFGVLDTSPGMFNAD